MAPSNRLFVLLVLMSALALVGCNNTVCGRKSDCNGGQVCSSDGVCELGTDAAAPSGVSDGGADATPADAANDALADAQLDATTGGI